MFEFDQKHCYMMLRATFYSFWHDPRTWRTDGQTDTACRVTTCLENLEMSGNLTAVREMSGILQKIREMSGKKSRQGKVA